MNVLQVSKTSQDFKRSGDMKLQKGKFTNDVDKLKI